VTSALERLGGWMLGLGNMSLRGTAPNGQRFWMAPRVLWRVAASAAVLDGEDLGMLGPLPKQVRLGDFWIPNRGILAFGETGFEALDPGAIPALSQGGLERVVRAVRPGEGIRRDVLRFLAGAGDWVGFQDAGGPSLAEMTRAGLGVLPAPWGSTSAIPK